MGVVYKATDPVIGRTVAVNHQTQRRGPGLTRPELSLDFKPKPALRSPDHPNIVVVFDAGEEMACTTSYGLVEGRACRRYSMMAILSRCRASCASWKQA